MGLALREGRWELRKAEAHGAVQHPRQGSQNAARWARRALCCTMCAVPKAPLPICRMVVKSSCRGVAPAKGGKRGVATAVRPCCHEAPRPDSTLAVGWR